MKWNDFIKILSDSERKSHEILNSFPEYHNFLKKIYPLLTYKNRQIALNKELTVLDLSDYADLIQASPLKDKILNILNQLKEAQIEKGSRDEKDSGDIDNRIKKIMAEISSFPIKEIEIINEFNIELRFLSINMDAIQAIKQHLLVNKGKTCLCKACVRVFIF